MAQQWTIRAGVVGAGVFGGHHARQFCRARGAALVGVYDPQPERARALADACGAEAFADEDAMLGAVDAVAIASPATHHAAGAARALGRGVHVLVEKPLALRLCDADRLIALAEAAGKILQVGHQEHYVARALGLTRRGTPRRLRACRHARFSSRAADVSVVMDLMIHDLHLLAVLAGDREAEVLACEAHTTHGPRFDRVDATLRVAGVEAELSASRLEAEPVRELELDYATGRLCLDFLSRSVTNQTFEPLPADPAGVGPLPELTDPLGHGTDAFLAAIRSGNEPEVDGRSGRAALRLALQVETAAEGAA